MALHEDSDSNDDQPLMAFVKCGHSENDAPASSTSANALHELPLARVKAIMQSGGEQVPISSEGLFAMTKAAELFLCRLTKQTYEATDKPRCMEYSHVAEYVQENDKLEFLHDMVPRMVHFADVMHLVQPSVLPAAS